MASPIRPTDEEARSLAARLLRDCATASLGVVEMDGAPLVTRIGFGLGPTGAPVTLVSRLSRHTGALIANPMASLMIGEPGARGDPLNHPRLTLQARATLIANDTARYAALARLWTARHPKAKLYVGFTDFVFFTFDVSRGHLNGGFGKAFDLAPADMGMPA